MSRKSRPGYDRYDKAILQLRSKRTVKEIASIINQSFSFVNNRIRHHIKINLTEEELKKRYKQNAIAQSTWKGNKVEFMEFNYKKFSDEELSKLFKVSTKVISKIRKTLDKKVDK